MQLIAILHLHAQSVEGIVYFICTSSLNSSSLDLTGVLDYPDSSSHHFVGDNRILRGATRW